MDIVFATGNKDKMREISHMLENVVIDGEKVSIYSMKEKGIDIDIEENGKTFLENALIKATAVSRLLPDSIVMADDSGLEVDYMNKEPGIYSARFLGVETPHHDKNMEILKRLKDAEGDERSARFVCSIAIILPGGKTLSAVETMEGRIAYEERGKNGFGYDPIFTVYPYDRTNSELEPDEKNAISHRGKALRAAKELLEKEYKSL